MLNAGQEQFLLDHFMLFLVVVCSGLLILCLHLLYLLLSAQQNAYTCCCVSMGVQPDILIKCRISRTDTLAFKLILNACHMHQVIAQLDIFHYVSCSGYGRSQQIFDNMKAEAPAYIIKYMECGQADHEGEKVNLICLNRECADAPLICSLCATHHHKAHQFKPLKIYLDELYSRYKGNNGHYGQELEDLEKRKIMLLVYLRNCVERLAEQFSRLEEDILGTYDTIRTQIQENEARRSRFEEFYLSMIKDNYGDPKFEVRNYLFKEEVPTLTDQDIFQELSRNIGKQISDVRGSFFSKKYQQPPPNIELPPVAFKLPPNVLCEGDVFTQSNHVANAQNLCLFDVQVSQWTNKLRVTVLAMEAGSRLVLGVMKREEFAKAGFQFKETLNCQYLDSLGKNKGAQSNYITTLGVNVIVDFFIKKNNLRAVCKNNNAIFNLGDKNTCFFFVLEGNAKIKITYPYVK